MPHINEASFLALCSPQNPTGTTFRKEELSAICEMIVEESNRRKDNEKKLYVMYDQMYWHLTYNDIKHYDPVSLNPGMRPYTIYVDAISKCFAPTGLRIGWSTGLKTVLDNLKRKLKNDCIAFTMASFN